MAELVNPASGMERRFPVSGPDLSDLESSFVAEAMRSTWISSSGRFLDDFERDFAQACGVSDAVAVCNGTVALHLVLATLGVGPGDEVIVPSLTYIATANSVRYTGAEPVFCDVDPDTWCLDPKAVEACVTERTVAVIAVHLYGHPADMDALSEVTRRHGLALVEDAAEAPFAEYHGRRTGGLGVAASFSFYGNKILTSGEGGAVTTDDPGLATRLRLLRGQGMDPDRRYFFPVVGFNFRMTNVAAAILCAQMTRRAELIARRKLVFATYDAELGGCEQVELQPVAEWAVRAPWMYTLLLREDLAGRRDEVMSELDRLGVETRPMFIPLHRMPPYLSPSRPALPVTDDLGDRGLSLPTSSVMTADDTVEVATRVRSVLTAL